MMQKSNKYTDTYKIKIIIINKLILEIFRFMLSVFIMLEYSFYEEKRKHLYIIY